MNFGYFDHENKEYVITRPDTPSPWINYLGQGGYGAIISNTAGGISFDGDPQHRRVTRYKYNNLPADRPGKYIYIRDMESKEYWSPTWQPVMKELDFYECRHGMGYTVIKGNYSGIEAETKYFVPLNKKYEVWKMTLKNNSNRKRSLKLFTYLEFSYNIASEDVICEWPRSKGIARYENGAIIFDPVQEGEKMSSFFGTDASVEGYDCRLQNFIGGIYRCETNPIALEKGVCSNSECEGDYSIGSLCCPVLLEEGEEKEIVFVLGVSDGAENSKKAFKEALNKKTIDDDFDALKKYWDSYISNFKVKTPDDDLDNFINVWHQYQCKTTFDWSRFISLYERGIDRGIGYRDSMQDVLGVMHTVPEKAKERMVELLKVQLSAGDAKSVYYPATKLATGGGRSDDHIWAIFSVCTYLKETGNYDFLDEVLPYYDCGEATVLKHLEQGIKFTMSKLGRHGIPLMLGSDWNDSISHIKRTGDVESVFVFFQLAHAVKELMELYEFLDMNENYAWAEDIYVYCKSKLKVVWDGEWFLRAFDGYGDKIGSKENEYAKIFLNAQSWAVLSGLPSKEQSVKSMDSVKKYMLSDYGIELLYPSAPGFDMEKKCFIAFSAGVRENGAVFSHSNPWAMISECLLGRPEYAFDYYLRLLPSRRNDKAEICKVEPYVYCSNILGRANNRHGEGANSWLTGTASWTFLTASQYIFGVRPDYDGVFIDPNIPPTWENVSVERVVRGVKLKIKIRRRKAFENRVKALLVNGKEVSGSKIPYSLLEKFDEVVIETIY